MTNYLNEIFDRIFWIGTKNRIDRHKRMLSRFMHTGVEAERFEGITGGLIDRTKIDFGIAKKVLNNAEIGCYLSHLEIYKIMKERGYKKILVLEDDALIRKETIEDLKGIYPSVPQDWQMLYFGFNNYDTGKPDQLLSLKEKVSGNVYVADRCWLTHAYAVDISAIEFLLENTKKLYSCYDNVLADLHKDLRVYAVYPSLINQDGSRSSLRK
jgi:GR25 family glycosyltransferase involved in LPS biosynthesis